MNPWIVRNDGSILLVGGGDCDNGQLAALLETSDLTVAVDGGADRLLALGRMPDALLGDLDSVSDAARRAVPADRIRHIAEQDSTDFEKALRSVSAPLILGAGFLGGRIDHQMAAMTTLVQRAERRVVLVGRTDLVLHCPPELALDLAPGTRLSLYPMRRVTGRSEGLRWPIDGLTLAPDGRVGTSNETCGAVRLRPDGPGMLLILPPEALPVLLRALARMPRGWPAP